MERAVIVLEAQQIVGRQHEPVLPGQMVHDRPDVFDVQRFGGRHAGDGGENLGHR